MRPDEFGVHFCSPPKENGSEFLLDCMLDPEGAMRPALSNPT